MKPRVEKVDKLVGECQICERTQKLSGGLLVLHGYKRPGQGAIFGQCPGVGFPPYELSRDRCATVLASVIDRVEHTESDLEKLARGVASIVTSDLRVMQPGQQGYENARKKTVHATERELKWLIGEVEHLTRRIEQWKSLPLRSVLESQQAKKPRPLADLSLEATKLLRSTAKGVRATAEIVDLREMLVTLGWHVKPILSTARACRNELLAKQILDLPDARWKDRTWQLWLDKDDWWSVSFDKAHPELASQYHQKALALAASDHPGFEVGSIEASAQGRLQFLFKFMVSLPSFEVTMPSGKTMRLQASSSGNDHKINSPTFWRDAYKAGLANQAQKFIDQAT